MGIAIPDRVINLVSFLIPLIVRSVPELLSPVPIGFDTVIYLVQAKSLSTAPVLLPFFSKLLSILYSFGLDLIVLMKILPPIFFATTIFLACLYARKKLGWSKSQTFLLAIIMAFSAAMLRMSWDLHRQSLATILLLVYLYIDPWKNLTIKKAVLSFLLIALIGLLHELVLVTVTVINLYHALLAFKMNLFKTGASFAVLAITPIIGYEAGYYISYPKFVSPNEAFIDLLGSWAGDYTSIVSNAVGVLVATFWYALPLAPLGFFHDRYLTPWMAAMLLGYLTQILIPFSAVRLAERWMLYMAIPLMFYTTNAISKLANPKRFRVAVTLFTLAIICINGFSMLGLVQPFNLPSNLYIGFIPSTMVFSTAKPEHVVTIISFSRIINDVVHKNACIVTHDPWFSYWVMYLTNAKVHSFSGYSPDPAISKSVNEGCKEIYVIWFKGQLKEGEMLLEGNQIALYRIDFTTALQKLVG
jgi:hypothetical protein